MVTKLKNCNILVGENDSVLFDSEIIICDNLIKEIGKNCNTMQIDNEIDLNGALVVPGLNNAFCFPYSLGLSIDRIENSTEYDDSIYYVQKKLNQDLDFNDLSESFVSKGITSAYLIDVENIEDLQKLKFKAGIFVTINDLIMEYDDFENNLNLVIKNSKLKPILLIKDILDVSEKLVMFAINLAKKYNLTIAVRLAKTLEDAGKIDKETGMSPVSYLESLGLLDRNCLILDATVLDKEDVNTLSLYDNILIAISSESDMILGNGIAPITSFVNKKLDCVLGFDNLACSSVDMFKEMYLSKNLQSVILSNRNAINSKEVFKFGTYNFAKLIDQSIGIIKEDNIADLVAIKNNRLDLNNIYDSLVNVVRGDDVILTMVDGKIVYKK